MKRLALLAVLMLPGCELLEGGIDLFEGLTNPLVSQGLVLGTEAPPEAAEFGIDEGTVVSVFLADAADVADLENAPVAGADVDFAGIAAGELEAGLYTIEPGAVSYGGTANLRVVVGQGVATASVVMPGPASPSVPETHSGGELTVALGRPYDTVLVVVVADDGSITYDNRPDGPRELYDLTGANAVERVTIPGSAFPGSGAYLVGVAGMENTEANQLDGMNTVLSNVMAGKLVFSPTLVP